VPASWSLSPPYFLALGFLCGVVGFRVGWRTRNRVALPIIQGFLGWGAFLLAWAIVGPRWGAAALGAWAAGTTVAGVYEFVRWPKETDARVIRATEYRGVMIGGLASGRGPEIRPGATLVQHLRESIYYVAAAVLTANLASLAMGAMLLNFMNAYVATLLRAAKSTGRVLAFAWPVWSLVRVASYVAIGVAAASPILSLCGMGRSRDEIRSLAIAGGAGLAIDLVLKLVLSGPWSRLLAPGVDLDAARENRSNEPLVTLHLS
jgi:hypothetical protein